MSKITPGPWKVVFLNRDLPPHVLKKIRYKPVEVLIGETPLRIANDDSGDANACLIAAAPDLLEALKAIMNERWSPAGRSEHVSDMARAAILKATGEA